MHLKTSMGKTSFIRVFAFCTSSTFTLYGLFSFFIFFSLCAKNRKKNQNAYKQRKIKSAPKKHLRGKWSLIRLFAFCAFAWLRLCAFGTFGAFWCFWNFLRFLCVWNLFVKKKKKEFTTALITLFTLLLYTPITKILSKMIMLKPEMTLFSKNKKKQTFQ